MPRSLPFLFAWLLALGRPAFGQLAGPAGPLAAAVATVQQRYTASFVGPPQLYNGPEYVDYTTLYRTRTGHQFFLTPDKQPGSVYYNGHYFTGLRLAYDVVRDQLVLPQPTSPLTLRLINERVGYFFISTHYFVRVVADSVGGTAIRTGYYEMLLDSTVQVVARRAKYLQERTTRGAVDAEFFSTDKLFLRKAGVYYPATGKRAVLRQLADRGPAVQQYAQAHKLRFRKTQLEATTVQLARYYCTLPPQ